MIDKKRKMSQVPTRLCLLSPSSQISSGVLRSDEKSSDSGLNIACLSPMKAESPSRRMPPLNVELKYYVKEIHNHLEFHQERLRNAAQKREALKKKVKFNRMPAQLIPPVECISVNPI